MFVQMFTGKVTDAAAARRLLEGWPAGPGQGATGWLGSTAGITDDGQLVVLARFESQDAALANSERPEQGVWWESLAANFDSEASFFESSDVDADIVGDPDAAGFVQVMRGRVSDPSRARELSGDNQDAWAAFRPEILGTLTLSHDAGEYVMAIYFTTEADAREGERKEPPAELTAQMEAMGGMLAGEVTYLDLRDPWLASPPDA